MKGQIQSGSIKKLKGFDVKILGWSLGIQEVIRKGDLLEFCAGVFSDSIHVSYFYTTRLHSSNKFDFEDYIIDKDPPPYPSLS